MNTRHLLIAVSGFVLGAAFLIAFHGVMPFYAHLPAGGERCSKCHDLHSAVRMEEVSCDAWLRLTGDVPEPADIDVAQLFRTHSIDNLPGVTIRDLLAEHRCASFHRVVIISGDGGHVAIDATDLTDTARLVPHLNAARFADERLHESAWLRGVTEICIVGDEPVLHITGQATTYGTLLAQERMTVLTESGRSALRDEATGRKRRNVTSRLITGVPLTSILDGTCYSVVVATGPASTRFQSSALLNAVISRDPRTNQVVLVVPTQPRNEWLSGVTAVDCVAPLPESPPPGEVE